MWGTTAAGCGPLPASEKPLKSSGASQPRLRSASPCGLVPPGRRRGRKARWRSNRGDSPGVAFELEGTDSGAAIGAWLGRCSPVPVRRRPGPLRRGSSQKGPEHRALSLSGRRGSPTKPPRTDQDLVQTLQANARRASSAGGAVSRRTGRVAKALTQLDATKEPDAFEDDLEHAAFDAGGTPWPEILRAGVGNIVARSSDKRDASRPSCISVPYAIARHQHARSLADLGGHDPRCRTSVDCRGTAGAVREAARSAADVARGTVSRCANGGCAARGRGGVAQRHEEAILAGESSRGFYGGRWAASAP